MPEGFKIASAYVEVKAELDETSARAAADQAAADVESRLKTAGGTSGKQAGEELKKGFDDATQNIGSKVEQELGASGSKSARNFADNFAAHQDEFTAFASTFSNDWFKKFNGNSEGALDELNKQFNEKFDRGGFSASNLFWEEFDKRAKRAVEDLGGGGGSGKPGLLSSLFSGSSLEQLGEVPSTIADSFMPILITGAIAATPAIGATIAGGITAAIGAAAIGGGLALQINNPAVHASITTLANDLEQELKTASTSFVEPATKAIGTIDAMFISEGPRFKAIFDAAAPSVEALGSGIANFIDRLLPGLEALTKASFPVLDEISGQLPGLGVAVRDFFYDLSNSGKGAGEAIVAAFKVVDFSLEGTGVVIEALTKTFDYLINNPVANLLGGFLFQKFFNDVKSGADTSGKSLNDFAGNSDQAAAKMTEMDNALQKLTNDFDKLVGLNLSAEQAQDHFREGLDQLNQAIQQNGVSLDQNTLDGAKNRDVLAQQVSNLRDARDAYIAQQSPILGVTQATEQANAIYGQNIVALENQAAKSGLSKQAVDALIRSLLGLPPSKSSTIATPGAATAKAAVDALSKSVNALPTYHEIDIVSVFTSKGTPPQAQQGNPNTGQGGFGGLLTGKALGGINTAATGLLNSSTTPAGIFSQGPLVMFAEPQTVQEAYIPRSTPYPDRSVRILDEAAGWYGRRTVPTDQPTQVVQPVIKVTFESGAAYPNDEQWAAFERRLSVWWASQQRR